MRLKPARIETFLLEAPITNSVRNSFHTLTAQPALLLRITDNDARLAGVKLTPTRICCVNNCCQRI